MSVNERIVRLMKIEGVKQNQFCAEIEYSQSSFSQFILGQTLYPRLDLLIKIVKHRPRWNIRWLLLGEGEMYYDENKMVIVQEPPEEYKGDNQIIKSLTEQLDYMRSELKKKDEIIEKLNEKLKGEE